MKKILFIVFVIVLVGLMIMGCTKETFSDVSSGIQFDYLSEEKASKYLEDFNPRDVKAEIVHKGLNSIYAAVNIPFNADIDNIYVEDGEKIYIGLEIKEGMERQDPLMNLASSSRKVIVLNSKYKKYFDGDKVVFAIDGKPVKNPVDFYTALSMGREYMETDFTADMYALELYYTGDEYRLAYIFSFGDRENMNRAGNEAITGVVAVDAESAEVLEYRIFSRNRFVGTYRFTSGLEIKGWKDAVTIVAADDTGYYLVDLEGNIIPLEESGAHDLVEAYDEMVSYASDYSFMQKCDENENGYICTTSAELTRIKDGRSIVIPIPQNIYITYHRWGDGGDNLYITTEPAEPSCGDSWSYYTLWRFNAAHRTLKELGKLPSREFFLSPDETRISFNGPDGDLFMMNIDKLIRDDEVLK